MLVSTRMLLYPLLCIAKYLIQLFRCTLGNPVRDTGPPACMAKLIMLRHKVR
jgi:hypothetical protein